MSLIHDALKSMDTPAVSVSMPDAPPLSATGMHSAPSASAMAIRPVWLSGVLAFAGVLGTAGVGWMLWQSPLAGARGMDMPPPPLPVVARHVMPVIVEATPVEINNQPVPSISSIPTTPIISSIPSMVSIPAAPSIATTQRVQNVQSIHSAPAPYPVKISKPYRQHSNRAIIAAPENAVSAPAVAAETSVELRFARFINAMKNEDQAAAEHELIELKKQLPAGTIGLVRAQAWFDLHAGHYALAAEGYRVILDRLPGDEEAAINLASIRIRQQRPEQARATLDAAVRVQPDSAALRAALGRFSATATATHQP